VRRVLGIESTLPSWMFVLALETGRVSPSVELLDYIQCYLFLHPFRCRNKRVLRYLSKRSVTDSAVIVDERLTNGASMFSFIVSRAASWHIDTTSAPENPSACDDMSGGVGYRGMRTYQKCNFRNIDRGINTHLG
jgi:hypothetical protein